MLDLAAATRSVIMPMLPAWFEQFAALMARPISSEVTSFSRTFTSLYLDSFPRHRISLAAPLRHRYRHHQHDCFRLRPSDCYHR